MYKKGDFHIHTTCSDGACTPIQIINKAKRNNVDILSITDHNSINGIHEAVTEGNKLGIKVIPGVEVSSRFNHTRVHILGYFKNEPVNSNLYLALSYIKTHNNKAFDKLMENGFNLSYRRNHICIEKAINLLKYYNAVVILAHPVFLSRKDFYNIIEMGFDGIEAKYFKNSENDTDFFVNYALSHNMVYTAGSDFHRDMELYRAHGQIGDVFLEAGEIENFLKILNSK